MTASFAAPDWPRPTLSLIFPIFNEEAVLPALLARLEDVIADLIGRKGVLRDVSDVEIIFVNDGSRDDSATLLADHARTRPWVRVLNFSRNFGHQIAVTAGMHHARGKAVVLLDADLQDPPELLPEMLRLWREEGWDVVYGVRTDRAGETLFKKVTASLFYRFLRRLTTVNIPADTGDFRLMDRKVVDALNRMNEHHRFLRGMAAWVGFRQVGLPYARAARVGGETKYPLHKMLKLAMDAVCSFSHAPLKLATNLGWSIAAVALAYAVVVLVRRLFFGVGVPGWASLTVVVSLLSGVQLITLGLIGEYIGRIYDEVKGRPLYLVASALGFGDDANGDDDQTRSTKASVVVGPSAGQPPFS
jgi:dolichol-phosphate mannosyltransferase